MGYGLGVDTGGTFTDAVILDLEDHHVISKAKSPTTHNDLSVGLFESVRKVLSDSDVSPSDIELIGVSTTLATNSVLEGKGGDVGLILIGWMPNDAKNMGAKEIAYVRGGYDNRGKMKEPLDPIQVKEAILGMADHVEAIAISGLFSIINASQEKEVKKMALELTGLPTVAGYELSSSLGIDLRAETAVLNGKLIPSVSRFFDGLERTFREMGMTAPIMMYKGDGSVMTLSKAKTSPVECIFSGPAASAMGARAMTGEKDFIMVDIGGTSTDVALMKKGLPDIREEGANIHGWRTMVKAVDMYTMALGGDSRIAIPEATIEVSPGVTIPVPTISRFRSFNFTIGPDRVMPLCRLAEMDPGICPRLEKSGVLDYYVLNDVPCDGITEKEKKIIESLKEGPKTKMEIADSIPGVWVITHEINNLSKRGIVSMASLTPIDLVVYNKALDIGNRDGPVAAINALSDKLRMDKDVVVFRLLDMIHERIAQSILIRLMDDKLDGWRNPRAKIILDELAAVNKKGNFSLLPHVEIPIVGIGAPTRYLMGDVDKRLGTETVFPDDGDVGNAIGAISSKITECYTAIIVQMNDHTYSVTIPYSGQTLTSGKEEAIAMAKRSLEELLTSKLKSEGAKNITIRFEMKMNSSPLDVTGETIDETYFEIEGRGIGDPTVKSWKNTVQ